MIKKYKLINDNLYSDIFEAFKENGVFINYTVRQKSLRLSMLIEFLGQISLGFYI